MITIKVTKVVSKVFSIYSSYISIRKDQQHHRKIEGRTDQHSTENENVSKHTKIFLLLNNQRDGNKFHRRIFYSRQNKRNLTNLIMSNKEDGIIKISGTAGV